MKVFCIALECEPVTGSQWFRNGSARDAYFTEVCGSGHDSEGQPVNDVKFDMEVPDEAGAEEIDALVDKMAWSGVWK